MKNKKMFLYADGGSRGNPGPSAIGVVILDEKKKRIKDISKYIGEATNNIAEYNAIIHGLEEAINLGAQDLVIHVDSELVAKQLKGEYRVKDENLKALFEKAVGFLKRLSSFEIKHIDRSKNKEADKLVNKALNLSSLF